MYYNSLCNLYNYNLNDKTTAIFVAPAGGCTSCHFRTKGVPGNKTAQTHQKKKEFICFEAHFGQIIPLILLETMSLQV